MGGVAVGVGDVVLVGEQDVGDPAELLEPARQLRHPAGRVDEEIAALPRREEGVGAEGSRRVVTAIMNAALDRLGNRPAVRGFWPTTPIEAVGQASIARVAARISASVSGWRVTTDCPSTTPKSVGAHCREVSQSMQESSTNQGPGAFARCRRCSFAMAHSTALARRDHTGMKRKHGRAAGPPRQPRMTVNGA